MSLPSCHIYQCLNGHLICKECYGNMTGRPILCAICRDPMPSTPIRNRVAEQVIAVTKLIVHMLDLLVIK